MLFLTPPAVLPAQGSDAPKVETVALAPSDDVWVYPHATDPARDETVRVWGAGGRSVAADAGDAEEFAYGYLRFALPARLKGLRLVGATLEVTNVPNANLDADALAATPLEARPLVGTFDEKGWVYSLVARTHPDPKVRWGVGTATSKQGEPIAISIDLMPRGKDGAGPPPFLAAFQGAFADADQDGGMGVALTSAVDAANVGMSAIYKVSTKESPDESRRPRLVLRFGGEG